MSDDDEPDAELLALLRQSLSTHASTPRVPSTKVLESASYICDHSVDVALDMYGCRAAAASIHSRMQSRCYSRSTWAEHELHPGADDALIRGDEARMAFIFTVDLLNFSFWSDREGDERWAVEYRGRRWTGYWGLVAALRRALEEGVEITDPRFWHAGDLTVDLVRRVMRSVNEDEMPMLEQRWQVLKEAGEVLFTKYESSIAKLVASADHSAAALVNTLAEHFPSFRDEHRFEGRSVRILKRAQILAADLWAGFDAQGYGDFADIDSITMFAHYRIPQMLNALGCLAYSPPLEAHIRAKREIPSGSSREVQLRGCSIWCVESLRREIRRQHPDAAVNAILIDFFLYDAMKEMEADVERACNGETSGHGEDDEGNVHVENGTNGEQRDGNADGESEEHLHVPTRRRQQVLEMTEQVRQVMPHHRTRSIWY